MFCIARMDPIREGAARFSVDAAENLLFPGAPASHRERFRQAFLAALPHEAKSR